MASWKRDRSLADSALFVRSKPVLSFFLTFVLGWGDWVTVFVVWVREAGVDVRCFCPAKGWGPVARWRSRRRSASSWAWWVGFTFIFQPALGIQCCHAPCASHCHGLTRHV